MRISNIEAADMMTNLAQSGYTREESLEVFKSCSCTPITGHKLIRRYTCPIHGDKPEQAKCGCPIDKVLAGHHRAECEEGLL